MWEDVGAGVNVTTDWHIPRHKALRHIPVFMWPPAVSPPLLPEAFRAVTCPQGILS